jgi:hypothetical protein
MGVQENFRNTGIAARSSLCSPFLPLFLAQAMLFKQLEEA